MRKIYKMAGLACLGLLLSTQNSKAQTLSDFEGLSLSPNSFWDGSDMSGNYNSGAFSSTFTDGTAIFPNVYDTTYGLQYASWSQGFAYSNMTDSTTSGFGNQHSARTAKGVNNSTNYGIAIQDNFNSVYPTIQLTGAAANSTVSGLYITNTTYVANSMRDGDFVGKQFGSPNDANGTPDGTNGEDWFLLTIKGYSGGNLTVDSVNFYLADYRFTNNAQDYIVTDWQWVDLTILGAVDSVVFMLTSSDVGSFGINTPTYFAFDNFNDQTVNVNEFGKELSFSIYPNPTKDILNIKLDENISTLSIIDVTGKTVLSKTNLQASTHQFDLSNLKSGLYFVKAIAKNKVKIERIIKK